MRSREKGLGRLAALRGDTAAAAVEMVTERGRFDTIAGAEPTRAIQAHQLFQTPCDIASQMARRIGPVDGQRILEPSAGLGRLVQAIQQRGTPAELVAVEVAPQCAAELYRFDSVRLIVDDFLNCDAARLGGLFDSVVMNPPFKMGRDIRHIRHAYDFLRPGGRLVALCFNGAKQNAQLKPWADTWEPLPAGSFRSEGTRADVVMLTKYKATAEGNRLIDNR